MRLFDAWKRLAYDTKGQMIKNIWDEYLALEKDVYKRLLHEKIITRKEQWPRWVSSSI
jgi:hypothetical protein